MLSTGAPVLTDALVSFDCEIQTIQDVGTHSIFICKIIAIRQGENEKRSLVYFDRQYHKIGQPVAIDRQPASPQVQKVD